MYSGTPGTSYESTAFKVIINYFYPCAHIHKVLYSVIVYRKQIKWGERIVEEIEYGALGIFIFRRVSYMPVKAWQRGTMHLAKFIFQKISVKWQLVTEVLFWFSALTEFLREGQCKKKGKIPTLTALEIKSLLDKYGLKRLHCKLLLLVIRRSSLPVCWILK